MNWKSLKKKLRTPQKKSLKLTDEYFSTTKAGACLIHMPTGSGKSGIIAIIANLQFDDCILIVTPRISLTTQIKTAVERKFFVEILDKPENPKEKKFVELSSKQKIEKNSEFKSHVFFATIQKIDWIRKNKHELYEQLTQKIKLVIFDEGHYEPAFSWSKTIRGFKTKMVLFTATPFRNDLKTFDISNDFIYTYKYNNGLEDKILREISFRSEDNKKDDDLFIEKVINYYKFKFGDFKENSPKLIIRCSRMSTIIRLAKRIKELHKNIPLIGIHDNFISNKIDYLTSKVPSDPPNHPAKIWLHQNKLLEGIDDSQFKMLAIYDNFNNDRSLIQQIGRLVRVSKNKEEEDYNAYVIDFSNGYHENIWEKYLEFDRNLDKGFYKPMSEQVLKALFEIGDEYEYLLDGFKKKFDFNKMSVPDNIKLPLRTNLIQKKETFQVEEFQEFLENKLAEDDKVVLSKKLTINGYEIYIYFTLNLTYSPYIPDYYSLNLSNDLILFFEFKNLLSYFDSTGYVPIGEEELGLGRVTKNRDLKKIFNLENSSISSVSLRNSNLGTNSIRSHSIAANSIDNTLSYLDDKSQIVSTATGKHKKEVQKLIEGKNELEERNIYQIINRYVGLTTGRISERGEWVNMYEYVAWVEEIKNLMEDSDLKPKDTFERYSQSINSVKETEPKHILLDIGEIEEDFKLKYGMTINGKNYSKNKPIVIADKCSEIVLNEENNKFEFVIEVSEQFKVTLGISFNKKTETYKIIGDSLDELFEPNNDSQYKTVTQFLNQRQSFKVIPKEPNVIYAFGEFYQVHSHFGKGFKEENFNLKDIIIPIKELNEMNSEKGKDKTRNDGESWVEDSIFGLLDDLGKPGELAEYIKDPDLVVVDDMSTEMADIIFAYEEDKESKIIFVHAKCGSNTKYSASALQEVTSQATKNIKYLNSYNELPRGRMTKWNSQWKGNNLMVKKRIRRPNNIHAKETMDRLDKIIQNPNSTKEVWLVLGKTLQRSKLLEALEKNRPEAIQSTLLLHSTLQSVGTVNAKLKVFCSP